MAIRKQLKWDDQVDIWPITDACAVHYTYNPTDSSRITAPVNNTSYGLDKFLNGLGDIFMSRNEVTGLATNINKGVGLLYNSAANTTAVAAPAAGTSNAFAKINYTSAGVFTITFDTTTYLPSSTHYAGSASTGGPATSALTTTNISGGAAGKLVYQSAAGTTAFLDTGTNGQILKWNNGPTWGSLEDYNTVTGVTSQNYTLKSSTWTQSIQLPSTAGVYALFIQDIGDRNTLAYGSYAGMFVVGTTSVNKREEIPLHWSSIAATTDDVNRVYAATESGYLKLSSGNESDTSHVLTIKYKRII